MCRAKASLPCVSACAGLLIPALRRPDISLASCKTIHSFLINGQLICTRLAMYKYSLFFFFRLAFATEQQPAEICYIFYALIKPSPWGWGNIFYILE